MKSLFNRSTAAMVAAALACGAGTRAAAQTPQTPASPLAGGQAAYQGGSYMDAHGDNIVMPVTFCEPGASYGEMCPPGGGGGGYVDPGYADFGGYSQPEQCGPYYFDIAANAVFLQSDRSFQDVPPLGSIGVAGPTILDAGDLNEDYEPGWEIAARLDLGPLSVIEATYMGIYDLGFDSTVNSVDVAPNGADFQLNSVFSDYGIDPIDGLDEGSTYNVNYQSDLQSTELTYRRYWLGHSPRISGTYLAGFRYVRMTEEMDFNAVALNGDSNIEWQSTNDLVGAQLGIDGWIGVLQGLRIGGETKGGIYNNRFKYGHSTAIPDPDIDNVDFGADGNQVAFVGEAKFDVVADILPSISIRGGYRVLYMSSLVTVGNNIDPTDVTSTVLYTQGDALYNGFHGGIEYIW